MSCFIKILGFLAAFPGALGGVTIAQHKQGSVRGI
jgi:hypothetical protein